MNLILALSIGAGSGLSAALGFLLLMRDRNRLRPARRTGSGASDEYQSDEHGPETDDGGRPDADIAILFARGSVVDATRDAEEMLATRCLRDASWSVVRDALSPRFPGLPESLPETAMVVSADGESGCALRFQPEGSQVRLVVSGQRLSVGLQHRLILDRNDHERLDTVMRAVPNPIWQTNADNHIVWGNAAFDRLCREALQPMPGKAPFDLGPVPASSPTQRERASFHASNGEIHWYEVTTERLGSDALHFATNIDGLVAAEMAQRNFVQTLTKTFAHLPIGLAVFDRNRQLVLFNPALVDLTRLPVDFLSARPNLLSFFDHMRENRIMPEPKNYANWRDQLAEVVSAARDDRYCETWNLSSGLTYKITGRPHPDGAVAFLMEDISAEISLTRRFRSELEMTQSVIDCFEDAVAVFSQLGVLTFSNAAFRTLWDCDPDSAFSELTIMDTTKAWQRACEPSPIWSELRDFVLTYRDRASWEADLRLTDGRRLLCMVEPVAAGATMVRFGLRGSVRAVRAAPAIAAV